MFENNSISISNLIANFPFEKIRPKQRDVLQQIGEAINAGYKYIVLEAPTGFGKSPVVVALGKTLGSSYICSSTKDLQTQYTKDFPFLRAIKGMTNFDCLVKEDFILNKTYGCIECDIKEDRNAARIRDCKHKTVNYGGCRVKKSALAHDTKGCNACSSKKGFHDGCRYRTWKEDYEVIGANTDREDIFMSTDCTAAYRTYSTNAEGEGHWMHLLNIIRKEAIDKRLNFTPCPYYDQLNKGILASHSIFNYSNFLIFVRAEEVEPRKLLVLDEGHQIENQIVEDIGISISKKTLQKYKATNLLEYLKYDYDHDIETAWLEFLADLYKELYKTIPNIGSSEIKIDANQYLKRFEDTIASMKKDPKNWIVSEIVYDDKESHVSSTEIKKVTKVTFKPVDVAPYCKKLFEQCDITLIMSATIIDIATFCRNIGLDRDQVKFIEVGSDFPIENRPIYPLNVAYLNYNSLQIPEIQHSIAAAVDKIMDLHANDKGIIHTTSYKQVEFIQHFLSKENRRRLISTDPEVPRDEIIAKHWIGSNKGSVLISPSLHTGLDLKDDQSRFQILVKIPYPSKADRWIAKKLKLDGGRWYNWQTALRLVQACGRSIRSKDDWAKTYVLDSAFDRFIRENKLPVWFREGIIQ